MVSALTLLRTGDGQADRSDWFYLLLADEVRRVGAGPRADLHELFGRMCFNAVVSNLDGPPQSCGDRQGSGLAPILPTISLPRHSARSTAATWP